MGILQDKVVVITGSGSGIGLATATMALSEGALVLGVDRSKLPASIPSNSKFEYLQKDLTDESTPAIVVSKCLELFGGRIDALLNIAGVMDDSGSVDTVSDATLDMCLSVNLTAPIRMMKAVIPIMRAQQNGSIVNVASKAGTSGAASGIAYTASKHGLIGATKNVAWRFRDEKIRCNAICPGGVITGLLTTYDTQNTDLNAIETMKHIHAAHMPGGQPYILPEEVARLILFLASDGSMQVNGAVIPIDNAWSTI